MAYENLVNISHQKKRGRDILYLTLRNEDGSCDTEKITKFRPYFYIEEKDEKLYKRRKGLCVVGDTNLTSLDGVKLKKVTCKNTKVLRNLRELASKTYEADLFFTNRFILDKVDQIKEVPLRTIYFDIEVKDDEGLSEPEDAFAPIISIAFYDTNKKKRTILTWRQDFDLSHETKVLDDKTIEIFKFPSEKQVISTFCSYVRKHIPDVLSGWNSTRFDMTYIFRRMQKLNLNIHSISPFNHVRFQKADYKNMYFIDIDGVSAIDLLEGYKQINYHKLISYSLDYIGEKELGYRKIEVKKGGIAELWQHDFDKFVSYNVRDVDITVKLDEKMHIIGHLDMMRRFAKVPFHMVFSRIRVIDSYLISKYKDRHALPTRDFSKESKRYKGAAVLEPNKGFHKNVITLDFKSLYPSIIRTFNICQTTIDKGEDVCLGDNKEWQFSLERDGVSKIFLRDLTVLRNEAKKKMLEESDKNKRRVLDLQQSSIKGILASSYGVFAHPAYRFFDPRISASVTWVGRQLMEWNKKEARKYGYEVIAGDTDSIFIKLPDDYTKEQCIEAGKKLDKRFNDSYVKFINKYAKQDVESRIKLEFEKYYKTVFFKAKKRYAGLLTWREGVDLNEVSTVGLETRRSDQGIFIRKMLRDFIELILKEKSPEEIRIFIAEQIKKIQNSKDYYWLSFSRGLGRKVEEYGQANGKGIPQHVRACIFSNEKLDMQIPEFSKPRILFIDRVNGLEQDVIAFHDNKSLEEFDIEIDYTTIIEKLFLKKIDKFMEILDIKYRDIVDRELYGINQCSLSEFVS